MAGKYSMHVQWSAEDEEYVAVCPELGGVSALAETPEEAIRELETVIELTLETYEKQGWALPEPVEVAEFSGQFRLRVPKSLHAWLVRKAAQEGVSLNGLVVSLLSETQGMREMEAKLSTEIRNSLAALKTSVPLSVRAAILSHKTGSSSAHSDAYIRQAREAAESSDQQLEALVFRPAG